MTGRGRANVKLADRSLATATRLTLAALPTSRLYSTASGSVSYIPTNGYSSVWHNVRWLPSIHASPTYIKTLNCVITTDAATPGGCMAFQLLA